MFESAFCRAIQTALPCLHTSSVSDWLRRIGSAAASGMTILGFSRPASSTHRKPTTEACVCSRIKSRATSRDFVGMVEPQQPNAQLIEHEQLPGLVGVAQGAEGDDARVARGPWRRRTSADS